LIICLQNAVNQVYHEEKLEIGFHLLLKLR